MTKKTLHITNGSSLTDYLSELNISGDFITWHEMLCEGPTIENINSDKFFKIRQEFLNDVYDVEIDEYELKQELDLLDHQEQYKEIVLWFEYDLFCHINLIGVLNLLFQKKITLPLYLVCSGRVDGESGLKGLSELTPEQLILHYKTKVKLLKSDLDLVKSVWRIYNGKDHNLLKPYIVTQSSFKYLSNCLKAHLRRYPNSNNGLNSLEYNILKIVQTNTIKSFHHLLGYALNYQGYYGFGDIQIERLIRKLSIFVEEKDNQIKLNRKGHEAMIASHNFASEINNNIKYGGINRLDYHYNRKENRLIKTIMHAQ